MAVRRNNHEWVSGGLSSSVPTTLTASASTNTLGNYSQIIASTDRKCGGIRVFLSNNTTTTTRDALVNIATGASLSETVRIPNLPLAGGANFSPYIIDLPLGLPAGTRIAANMRASAGSLTSVCAVQLLDGPMDSCSEFAMLGTNTADSGGTPVDPGTTINTKGNWVSFSSVSFAVKYMWIFAGSGIQTLGANTGWALDVGLTASPYVLVPDIPFFGTASIRIMPSYHPLLVDIPANTQINLRNQCSVNTSSIRIPDFHILVAGDGPRT